MANNITHLYYGLETVKNSSEEIKEIVKGDEDAFIFGTMGPDFLFGLRELGLKEKKLPNLMHALKHYELFDATAEYLRENYDKTLMSYMLGFLTHYIIDHHVHAYVGYFCENELLKHMPYEYSKFTHNIIELAGDEYVLNNFMGYENSNDYKFHKALRMRCSTAKKVGKLFENVISKVYGCTYSSFNGRLSHFVTRATFWMTRDKNGKKMKLVRFLEKAFGLNKQMAALMRPAPGYGEIDYMNFEHKPWSAVRNREETVDLDYIELLDVAVKTGSEIYFPIYVAAVRDGVKLDREFFRINFEGVDYAYIYEIKNGLKSPAVVAYQRVEKPEPIEEETVEEQVEELEDVSDDESIPAEDVAEEVEDLSDDEFIIAEDMVEEAGDLDVDESVITEEQAPLVEETEAHNEEIIAKEAAVDTNSKEPDDAA
ncbi:MAG: zinc dependent phospholipase C family protein [Christensenellales bacterium]|jgi:hypothetical protein